MVAVIFMVSSLLETLTLDELEELNKYMPKIFETFESKQNDNISINIELACVAKSFIKKNLFRWVREWITSFVGVKLAWDTHIYDIPDIDM